MTPFTIYMTAYLILIAGFSLAAWLLGVNVIWIAVGIVLALAAGFIAATTRAPAESAELPSEPHETDPPDAAA